MIRGGTKFTIASTSPAGGLIPRIARVLVLAGMDTASGSDLLHDHTRWRVLSIFEKSKRSRKP